MNERKTQLSVFLEPQVLKAARQRAADMKQSMSHVVAEAAKESLLSAYRSEREILKAVERNLHTLRRIDQRLALEVRILKEMIGLGMRSFFNHTTPIPDAAKAAAILSGKQRFGGYLDMLAKNLRRGDSILSDVPMPEVEPAKEKPPASGDSAVEANRHLDRMPRPPKAARPDRGASHREPPELALFDSEETA